MQILSFGLSESHILNEYYLYKSLLDRYRLNTEKDQKHVFTYYSPKRRRHVLTEGGSRPVIKLLGSRVKIFGNFGVIAGFSDN